MKRTNRLATFMVAGLVLTALAVAAQQTFTLARVAKAGDEAEYKFEAKLDFTEFKIDVSGKTTEKVTKVSEDGTVEYTSTQSDVKVKTPDDEQSIDEPQTTKMSTGPDRVLVTYGDGGDEDASSIRLSLLGTVKKPDKPIQVGDKWSATLKHKAKETFPVKAEYEAVALETIGEGATKWETMKVKITTKETEGEAPASAEGFVWIILSDGLSAKEEMKIKKAPFPMSPDPIDMDIKVTRTK